MYLTEYHHHTDNSFDSKANMKDVCKNAIERGIKEICFTEHFSVNPKVPTYGHMNFQRYFSQIEECREKFRGQLVIKAGIELCEPYLMREEYREVLFRYDFDFIMGSVHNIDERKLRLYIPERDKHEVYQRYFEEVYQLVSYADIDVAAHLDLMKRYAIESIGNYSFEEFKDLIAAILEKAISRNIGFEINTSGISNKKVGEAFPKLEVLKLYRDLGGEILTIGSDSHRAETVGSHLIDALHLAKEAGFDYIYTFENRNPKKIKIEL